MSTNSADLFTVEDDGSLLETPKQIKENAQGGPPVLNQTVPPALNLIPSATSITLIKN